MTEYELLKCIVLRVVWIFIISWEEKKTPVCANVSDKSAKDH